MLSNHSTRMEKVIDLQFVKNIILGKNKPKPLLRFLCWATLIWDVFMAGYMLATAVVILIRGSEFTEKTVLQDFTAKFCFTYAILHILSLISAILLYRQKKIGFWLYSISNIGLVISTFVYLQELKADYIQIGATAIMIGLFATQWNKLR